MVKSSKEFKTEFREAMRGGEGTVKLTSFVNPEDLCDKGRLFGKITLEPGCSIGYHVHETDCELFYILKGTATYSDGGEIKTVTEGDVTITPAGTGHSISNDSDEVVELIALIVYA